MMKGYDDNQKTEELLVLSPLNYVEQNLVSLQINKTLTKTTIHSNTKNSAYDSFPLLYERFSSELFTKNDEMQNPLVYIYTDRQSEVPNGRCDLCSLNSVVAVFSGGVPIVKKFCNLQFL